MQAKKAQVDASILQATAAYNNAKKDYDRFMALFKQQSASQKELDDMTARYEMAKAGLEGAKQMRNEVMAQFFLFEYYSSIFWRSYQHFCQRRRYGQSRNAFSKC